MMRSIKWLPTHWPNQYVKYMHSGWTNAASKLRAVTRLVLCPSANQFVISAKWDATNRAPAGRAGSSNIVTAGLAPLDHRRLSDSGCTEFARQGILIGHTSQMPAPNLISEYVDTTPVVDIQTLPSAHRDGRAQSAIVNACIAEVTMSTVYRFWSPRGRDQFPLPIG